MTATTPATARYRVRNIPDELKALDHWVVFALEPGKSGRSTKVPYTPGTRSKARVNDSATWRSFAVAHAAAERDRLYLGFAFTPELGLTFLDLDGVVGAGGVLKAYARRVVDALDSYTEVSLNGGVHVFVRGRPPERFSKDGIDGKIEVYPGTGGHFCLVTGNTRPGLGSLDGHIEERAAELAALLPPVEATSPAPSMRNGMHAALGPAELGAIVAALAPSWQLGQKHDMAVAVGGILVKSGVSEAQAVEIVTRLSADDERPEDRIKAVQDSYRRAREGREVIGYQALREMTPTEALAIVDSILARVRQSQRATIVTPGRNARLLQGRPDEPGIDRWPAPPPEVYHGWFGGYLELVHETTEAPDQFHLAAALTVVGAYAGRKVFTRHASGRIFPNLYTVLVGPSSESKKDTAIARACEMVMDPPWARERTAPPYVEKFGVASAESFIKGLSTNSNVLIRMSEFSEVLANARRKGTSTILTMLMKAWDAPPQLSNDSITNPAIAFNPYICILAGTQPDVLAADLVGTDISSGFANRILFVPGSGKARMPRPPEVDERKLHEHWLRARRNLQQFGIGEHIEIDWSDARSVELWDAFYLTPRGETTIERTMSQRHQNMVLKIALIFALTDCSRVIEYQHLTRAIAFLDWEWACLRQIMTGWATSNDNRLEERILAVLRAAGPMRRRDLQRRTKDPKWSSNDFARLIRSMLENQTLGIDENGFIGIRED